MEKLNITFSPAQVLKASAMNLITEKINEVVVEANKLPVLENSVKQINESEVDISKEEFDELKANNLLDPTKKYYIYEEE